MGKICWINGQPYSVTLPTGGDNHGGKNNQWDEMIEFLGEDESDSVFHWAMMTSWCQKGGWKEMFVRGGISARYTGDSRTLSLQLIGFRPILIPLNEKTLIPDPELLADIPDGYRFALASLYMDNKVVQNPTKPFNIPDYIEGADVFLGDRDANPKNWIYVIKHKGVLWSDRNLLKKISSDSLEKLGFAD